MNVRATLASVGPRLQVRTGSLAGSILENSFTDTPPALEFVITVAFEPVTVEGETMSPSLRLGPLDLAIRRWSDLSGVVWHAPVTREVRLSDGEPHPVGPSGDGMLDLGERCIPLETERVAFGAIDADTVPARFALQVAGQHAGAEAPHEIDVTLRVEPIRILGDVLTKPRPGRDDALELASRLLDVGAFEAREEDGVVSLYPRSRGG